MFTTSSPSPTITFASHTTPSPHFTPRSHYDPFTPSTRSPHFSTRQSQRPQSVASTRQPSASIATPKSVPLQQSSSTSASALQAPSPNKRTVDAGTQYSPPVESLSKSISKTTLASGKLGAGEGQNSDAAPIPAPMTSHSVATTSIVTGAKRTSPDSPIAKAPDEPNPRSTPQRATPTPESPPTTKRARPDAPAVKLMPLQYEQCDTRDLVLLISSMLMELIRYNDAIPLRDGHLTRFHSRAPPTISVIDYLQRLTTHATLSPPILLSMVYYIDRLCALYPAFTISSLTVHRFLITSATVASKGLSDSFWTNKTYARVGGVSLKELALLELEFLWRVEWRIVPRPEVLVDYYHSLVDRAENYEIDVTGQWEALEAEIAQGHRSVVDTSNGRTSMSMGASGPAHTGQNTHDNNQDNR